MKRLLINFLVLVGVGFSPLAFSEGVESFASGKPISVKDGDSFRVKLSTRDLNRIAIKGGRISKLWSREGFLIVDKAEGEALILPQATAPAVFSFFVRDEFGSTYTLVAERFDIPAQSVVLDPVKKFSNKKESKSFGKAKSDPIKARSNRLIKAMALDEDLRGYSKTLFNSVVPLWKETKISLVRAYEGRKLRGDVYLIENVSDKELTFSETEFQDFGDDVFGIALSDLSVMPGGVSTLYVVRRLSEVNYGR